MRWIVLLMAAAILLPAVPARAQYACGDVDQSGGPPNVADIDLIVDYLFRGNLGYLMYSPADVDGVRGVNVADLVYLVSYIFRDGPAPQCPAPGDLSSGGCLTMRSTPSDLVPAAASPAECLSEVGEDSTESMWAEWVDGHVYVHHENAYYQCCLEYGFTREDWGFDLTIYEQDLAEDQCDCMCYFDLVADVGPVSIMQPVDISVTLIGIDGDTVGVDTIFQAGQESWYCEVVGNDLHVIHKNALANCCPGWVLEGSIIGNEITVTEVDTLGECACLCLFNLETVVPDLLPGEYIVTLKGVCLRRDDYQGPCEVVGVDTVVVGGP